MSRSNVYTPEEWETILRFYSTSSNVVIAKDIGVTTEAVRYQRKRLGIDPFVETKPGVPWAQVSDLHTASGQELARRFGVSKSAVCQARKRHKVIGVDKSNVPRAHTSIFEELRSWAFSFSREVTS